MNTVLTSLKKIKPKYIGCWLKDQLSRPDWFRNMVVNRSAWGAFSMYAHVRRSDGKAKVAYITKVDAEEGALKMSKKYGVRFVAYKCLFCDGWHVRTDFIGQTSHYVSTGCSMQQIRALHLHLFEGIGRTRDLTPTRLCVPSMVCTSI